MGAGRLEHLFRLLKRQEEALHDQEYQLKHCPCPKCGLSLLHRFLKAGQASTNSSTTPAAVPGHGGLQLLPHLLGLAQPPILAFKLAS